MEATSSSGSRSYYVYVSDHLHRIGSHNTLDIISDIQCKKSRKTREGYTDQKDDQPYGF